MISAFGGRPLDRSPQRNLAPARGSSAPPLSKVHCTLRSCMQDTEKMGKSQDKKEREMRSDSVVMES